MDRVRYALVVFIALTALGCSGSGSLSVEEVTDLVMRDEVGDFGDRAWQGRLLGPRLAARAEVLWRSGDLAGVEDTLARARAIAPVGHVKTASELTRVEALIRTTP